MHVVLQSAMAGAGHTSETLAERIGVDPRTVARWLATAGIPHPRHRAAVARTLNRAVGELWPDPPQRRREPAWFRPWVEVEREATALRSFQVAVLPGLLQTEAYARAVLASGPLADDDLEEYVTGRLDRQSILERPQPPQTFFVIDELALRRGDPRIMHPQLDHLAAMAERPGVNVHVLPLRAGLHPGQAGAFVIANHPDATEIGYVDGQDAGRITRDIEPLRLLWENLRSIALPRDQSIDLLRKRPWLN